MLKSDGKRAKIIVAMGLVAIVLIAFSSFFQSNDNKATENETSFDYSQYSDETKKQLTNNAYTLNGRIFFLDKQSLFSALRVI